MQNKKLAKMIAGIFLAAAALSGEATAATTDFIVNGTFSDHNLAQQTGWNTGGSDGYMFINNSYLVHNDIGYTSSGSLSQNVMDVAGGTDTLSFNLLTTNHTFETVLWNNTVLANLSVIQPTSPFTYNVMATGHDTLTFIAPNDAMFSSSTISNVALNGNIVPTVPEPAPATMLLIGVGLIGWIARRKSAATA